MRGTLVASVPGGTFLNGSKSHLWVWKSWFLVGHNLVPSQGHPGHLQAAGERQAGSRHPHHRERHMDRGPGEAGSPPGEWMLDRALISSLMRRLGCTFTQPCSCVSVCFLQK